MADEKETKPDDREGEGIPITPENQDEERNNIPLPDGDAVFSGTTIRFPDAPTRPSSKDGWDEDSRGGQKGKRSIPGTGGNFDFGPLRGRLRLVSEEDISDAGPEEDPVDPEEKSFLSFFEEESGDSESDRQFQKRFQSFFQSEGEEEDGEDGEESEGGDEGKGIDDLGESDEDAEKSPDEVDFDDLSEDEIARREEEEAVNENLDALIRQNDADTLFVLGDKYENREDAADIASDNPADGNETLINPTTILEAMVFVGNRENRPLPIAKAVSLMRDVTEEEARRSVEELNRRYSRNGAPYRIQEDADGLRMILLPEYEPVREHFFNKTREFKLSQKAIDILALIAYQQPISFPEIQQARPQSASVVNLLLKRGLIAQEKRTQEKGSVNYYRTTPRLLKLLGIDSLDDLPIVDEVDYR